MRLAVIGAGVGGLTAAKNGLAAGLDVMVFEQEAQLGGTWVFSSETGKNQYGIDVHSSMYKGLHTNLPKEIMGFPDFPIPAQQKSYIPSEDILAFLNLYADQFKVRERIKFLHHVVRVRPLLDDSWEIIVRNLVEDKYETMHFDCVLVCNGHYHTPAYPKYDGSKEFLGKQLHSHDYRCPEPFKGERVLVIGAGPSGVDLAYEISKHAEMVTLSHHLKNPPKTIFPENVNQKPNVLRLTANSAVFEDNSEDNYTVIFYCTGYKYQFPFLSVDCGVQCDNNYVRPLYKHCLSINRPTLGFIGLPFYVCATQMFDLQVRFCLKFITGVKPMPTREEMQEDTDRDMEERWNRGYKQHQAHMMGPDQNKYYADLSQTAEIEPLKPVITKLHSQSSRRFLDDLTNFRKDIFRILDDETFIKLQ